MKKLEVVVNASQVDSVRELLARVGVDGMSISEVRGMDGGEGHVEVYRGFESRIAFVPKVKIEIVVEDGRVPMLLYEIDHSLRARFGDETIFVIPIHDAVRVRTGERGRDAI